MDRDLARAFDFILRADMAGTRTEPFPWGRAVLLPPCPLRHDSNYLLVERPVPSAAALAAEADRVLGGAGLRHRCAFFRDAGEGERLAGEFADLGWTAFRGLVMARRRPPEKAADPARVEEVAPGTPAAAALRAAREAEIRRQPWGTGETARQLLDARAHLPVPARPFAVFQDGAPVSWGELYAEGTVAQVEAVATEERFRGKGFASAVVLRAAAGAEAAGAVLVFLCADAGDWPQNLYRRLGFDGIGRYVKFTKA